MRRARWHNAAMGLADELRDATGDLHARAERTGMIGQLMRGQGSRAGYVLLLRNLLPAYRALEHGLEAHRTAPAVAGVARREVYRAEAIARDLVYLHGAAFESALPLLPAGAAYARRIEQVAGGEPYRLLAHAYTRYLGDLSGGQLLARSLRRTLALEPAGLSFLEFPAITGLAAFKAQYRAAIDAASPDARTRQAIVNEARAAFEYNIAISDAVLTACDAPHAHQTAAPTQ